mgnify:CR=1 FL=1
MAQADGVVANGSGASVRADINNQLAAVFTTHSGATAPATTYAYQFWADTTASKLKIRNSANSDWVVLRDLDGGFDAADGTASAPGIKFASDPDTGIIRPTDNAIAFVTNAVERFRLGLTSDTSPQQAFMWNTTKLPVTNQEADAGFVIDTSGKCLIGQHNRNPFTINRTGNDGNLTSYMQDGVQEGSMNVSGTTVFLSGAHLSRWSQLENGAERIQILRGSVMSNLNQMCVWGDENNEQLNRTKVSDVEGDANVAGVFDTWDDDDTVYTKDFYIAMTGDNIIRIAQGTTVERGDLLMSAGDGTAKPQGDDIVRSKTVAKVTSTEVALTHPDGSYCVPCVLMAC